MRLNGAWWGLVVVVGIGIGSGWNWNWKVTGFILILLFLTGIIMPITPLNVVWCKIGNKILVELQYRICVYRRMGRIGTVT